jgi:hypothetical protein
MLKRVKNILQDSWQEIRTVYHVLFIELLKRKITLDFLSQKK